MKIKHKPSDIFEKYFKNQPVFDALERAHIAYHTTCRDNDESHSFKHTMNSLDINIRKSSNHILEKFQNEKCEWCNQSRREIRFGSGSPNCKSRPTAANASIEEALTGEEVRYFALLESASDIIPKVINAKFAGNISPEALIYCQTTLGYEPDIVAGVMDVDTERMMPRYEELMNEHRDNS